MIGLFPFQVGPWLFQVDLTAGRVRTAQQVVGHYETAGRLWDAWVGVRQVGDRYLVFQAQDALRESPPQEGRVQQMALGRAALYLLVERDGWRVEVWIPGARGLVRVREVRVPAGGWLVAGKRGWYVAEEIWEIWPDGARSWTVAPPRGQWMTWVDAWAGDAFLAIREWALPGGALSERGLSLVRIGEAAEVFPLEDWLQEDCAGEVLLAESGRGWWVGEECVREALEPVSLLGEVPPLGGRPRDLRYAHLPDGVVGWGEVPGLFWEGTWRVRPVPTLWRTVGGRLRWLFYGEARWSDPVGLALEGVLRGWAVHDGALYLVTQEDGWRFWREGEALPEDDWWGALPRAIPRTAGTLAPLPLAALGEEPLMLVLRAPEGLLARVFSRGHLVAALRDSWSLEGLSPLTLRVRVGLPAACWGGSAGFREERWRWADGWRRETLEERAPRCPSPLK